MTNKALLPAVIALLVVIAGYLGYLAWDRSSAQRSGRG